MRFRMKLSHLLTAMLVSLTLAADGWLTSCSKSSQVEDEDTDGTPPTAISDLEVLSSTAQTAMLQWTTPADLRNDGSGGMVDEYDLRVSFDSITTQNFASAVVITSVPGLLPAGHVQQWPVDGLTPGATHFFALKSADDRGNWSALSNCVSVKCAALVKVVFSDPMLEQAIRARLGRSTGDILSADVDTIWQVVIQDAGIQSLNGMEHFTSLRVANFTDNEVVDLTPIGGLPLLAGLYMARNQISDLTPLAGMKSLRQIHLDDNPLSDIGPLASVDSLQQLILWGTQVTDFSPLYGLYFLSDCGFDRMNLTEIGFMSHLKRPQICGLAFNQITSVEPLRGLYMLEALNLMQNQISDISALAALAGLRELKLTNNQITDIMPLVNNTGLLSGDVVYLEGNPLSQYSINVLIPTLEARGVTVHH